MLDVERRRARSVSGEMTASPYILLDDSLTQGAPGAPGTSLLYDAPERVVVANEPHEVEAGLDAVTQGLASGLEAAGFFSYELGFCLEPKLVGLMPKERRQPLLWI